MNNEQKNFWQIFGDWLATKQSQSKEVSRQSSWLPTPGNIIFTLLALAIFAVFQQAWATPQAAVSTVNPTINYQGRLADSGGVPIDGNVAMSFAIFDAPSGGNLIWGPETHATVPVADGLFNAGLGSLTGGGIPATVWQGGDRYLQITVAGETLAPRELIRSVPVASMALAVPDGSIQQSQAQFAPKLYYQPDGGSITPVNQPIIYSGWFHGGSSGQQVINLSGIFSQIDAVTVTKTRTSGGVDTPVIFKVTDASGLNKATPSEIKISAYDMDGNLVSWIQAYIVITGR